LVAPVIVHKQEREAIIEKVKGLDKLDRIVW
jgi:hypothetical protein